MYYDVIIIGGGPAGSAAAISIVKEGFSVCILEKNKFPKDKVCAGIITQKAYNLLLNYIPEFSFEDYEQTDKVSLLSDDSETFFYPLYPLTLVERKRFDLQLINLCRTHNVAVYENVSVNSIVPTENLITLETGQTLSYGALVAADGCLSYVQRVLGYDKV